MVIIITGATHSGKTALAQKLMERLSVPYVCQDHIKMGLIRSRCTDLTPYDDDMLTDYLWPITREMVKTAIENRQNLIVEGCYIPFDWEKDFSGFYTENIRYICLCLSGGYIRRHFDAIKENASCIEKRIADDDFTEELIARENRKYIEGCKSHALPYVLIEDDYSKEIGAVLAGF